MHKFFFWEGTAHFLGRGAIAHTGPPLVPPLEGWRPLHHFIKHLILGGGGGGVVTFQPEFHLTSRLFDLMNYVILSISRTIFL